MSTEDMQLVRKYYEAANRRDWEALVEFLDPEIEFRLAGLFPDLERVYRGYDGIQRFFDQFSEPWQDLSIEPTRIIDRGDRVLAMIRFDARGRDGIEVNLPLAHLWTFREGRALRLVAYSDLEKALEACGLSA